MSREPSSPEFQPVVALVLIGRTLRGTLGEAFRAEAVHLATRELLPAQPEPHTALSRTVELTAVAVTDAGPVRVTATIADPVLSGGRTHETVSAPAGSHLFEVDVDAMPGIHPLAGRPGLDLSRRVSIVVDGDERPRLEVLVAEPG